MRVDPSPTYRKVKCLVCRICENGRVLFITYAKSNIVMTYQTTTTAPTFLSDTTRNKIERTPLSDVTITYGIIEELYTLCNRSRVAYGIATYADVENDATATIVASVHDISSDPNTVTELADICNRLKVPPHLLREVVEDFLEN